jgi:hypothetical protein
MRDILGDPATVRGGGTFGLATVVETFRSAPAVGRGHGGVRGR